jgi:hypothetical protein
MEVSACRINGFICNQENAAVLPTSLATYHIGCDHNLAAGSLEKNPLLFHGREIRVQWQYFDIA